MGAAILFLLALAAQLGMQRVGLSLAVLVLVVVQIILGITGEDHAVVGIFHPLNAVLIAALTGALAGRAWRSARR